MTLQKKDFIEIDFIGKLKDNQQVFDSNILKELKKINPDDPNLEQKSKPFIFALGENMFLSGIDEFLLGKPLGKYTIELEPEKAFGLRNQENIKLMPMSVFTKHKINPIPGVVFNFDNRPAKILSVSGGRVRVDFNNPLAGKAVTYELEVKKKLTDIKEKTKALIEFFVRQEIPFEIKEKKLIIEPTNELAKFLELFKDKFKELLDLDLEIKKDKKQDKPKEKVEESEEKEENKEDISKKQQ